MKVVYAQETPPETWSKAIFLVGPSPRSSDVPSWRTEALSILDECGYDGVVFVPESRPETYGGTHHRFNYIDQIEWEERWLHASDFIVAWVPRDREKLPGFTTNIEFGVWQNSGKLSFGAPEDAWKMSYLRYYATKLGMPTSTTLRGTIRNALQQIGPGDRRSGGEREVPLHIWRAPQFQEWRADMRAAGNTLRHARVLWAFRLPIEKRPVFYYALYADVQITAEGRSKREIVLARPDIAAVVLFKKAKTIEDSIVVLIRDFRAPVSNVTGYVWELPSGSSVKGVDDPRQLAVQECKEETGLTISPERIGFYGVRQLVATMSSHRAFLFGVEITDKELEWLRSQKKKGNTFGVAQDGERTFIEPCRIGDILKNGLVDWSMLGMIMQVVR